MDCDPLWRCLDSSKSLTRDQLELVIQKKKINEIFSWFQDHFVDSTRINYLSRCPIVIIQGPTGCGKTSTLKWISNELKITIKEYSETTDTTAINHELSRILRDDDRTNLSQSIDRRNALKFEHFIINSIRYNTLYPSTDQLQTDDAASEFDSDDLGFVEMTSTSSYPNLSSNKPPPVSGVIIHIETPLTFARSQRILIQSLHKLVKVIRDISKKLSRRVAIVFESLEGEYETLAVPTKVKQSLGIQTFKFNPITRANMKKLVDNLVKNYKHIIFEKETIDQLVNDCDGDIRACINSLQLICNRSTNHLNNNQNNNSVNTESESLFLSPFHKRQKLNHEKVRQVKLNANLMRDNTRSLGFFHALGKIFYQKRLYPDPDSIEDIKYERRRNVDRPFTTENSTEYLANVVDVHPRNLMTWLHQHYYKFCGDDDIAKASLFLENLSVVDTTCIGSTLSSQFYEMHNSLDQLQIYLAIEATVFSLYHDQSNSIKRSDKKSLTDYGYKIIKSSVEKNGGMDSFNKPSIMSLNKVADDHRSLLDILETMWEKADKTKLLIDYIPYMYHKSKLSPEKEKNDVVEILGKLIEQPEPDFDAEHEKLLELIEGIKSSRLNV